MVIRNFLKFSFIWNCLIKKCIAFSQTSFGTLKYDCVTKIREMFSFLPLINNSVTIVKSFLITKHISSHIIKSD